MIRISEILSIDSISLNNNYEKKEELLSNLVELASKSNKIIDVEKCKKAVFDREDVMSTGVGKGIAIPHAKTESIKDAVAALVTLEDGIDFKSLDKKEVNIAFLLLSEPINIGNHLRMLSLISKLLNNESLRDSIIHSKTSQEVMDVINRFEKDL
jgi:fructose-specific phosphotransferase system IIA component